MGMRRLALGTVAAIGIVGLAAIIAAASPRAAGPAPSDDARQTVPAPIDRLEVVVSGTQATLKLTAGLPSGCAKRDSSSISRAGDTISVTVLNSMPKGNPVCTMIYGQYDLSIDLGSSFTPGASYTVRVNDKTTTFKI